MVTLTLIADIMFKFAVLLSGFPGD
jgi:hypothetical protein